MSVLKYPAGGPALLLPLLLLLMMDSAAGQDPPPALPPAPPPVPPPPAVQLAPVGINLPQYPSYIQIAAEIRRGLFSRMPTLEQLDIWPENDTVTVRGQRYRLDARGGATVDHQRLQVSGHAVSIDGIWYYPGTTAKPPLRRKPDLAELPAYDGLGVRHVRLAAMLAVTVPAAATMLVLLLCCLGCTHRRCWCCGICDGQFKRSQLLKIFNDDEQLLTVA